MHKLPHRTCRRGGGRRVEGSQAVWGASGMASSATQRSAIHAVMLYFTQALRVGGAGVRHAAALAVPPPAAPPPPTQAFRGPWASGSFNSLEPLALRTLSQRSATRQAHSSRAQGSPAPLLLAARTLHTRRLGSTSGHRPPPGSPRAWLYEARRRGLGRSAPVARVQGLLCSGMVRGIAGTPAGALSRGSPAAAAAAPACCRRRARPPGPAPADHCLPPAPAAQGAQL